MDTSTAKWVRYTHAKFNGTFPHKGVFLYMLFSMELDKISIATTSPTSFNLPFTPPWLPRWQGSCDQHGVHLCPRRASHWPHESCYQGSHHQRPNANSVMWAWGFRKKKMCWIQIIYHILTCYGLLVIKHWREQTATDNTVHVCITQPLLIEHSSTLLFLLKAFQVHSQPVKIRAHCMASSWAFLTHNVTLKSRCIVEGY